MNTPSPQSGRSASSPRPSDANEDLCSWLFPGLRRRNSPLGPLRGLEFYLTVRQLPDCTLLSGSRPRSLLAVGPPILPTAREPPRPPLRPAASLAAPWPSPRRTRRATCPRRPARARAWRRNVRPERPRKPETCFSVRPVRHQLFDDRDGQDLPRLLLPDDEAAAGVLLATSTSSPCGSRSRRGRRPGRARGWRARCGPP